MSENQSNNSGNNSGSGGAPPSNKPRNNSRYGNRRRRYNNKNKPTGDAAATNAEGQQAGQKPAQQAPRHNPNRPNQNSRPQQNNNRPQHNNNRPHHNNNRPPRPNPDQKIYSGGDPRNLSPAKIVMHYDHLLEIHNKARTEYYEMFNRANPAQKDKLEKKYFATLQTLRDFEETVNPQQKEELLARIDNLPKDLYYSQTNGIAADACDPLPLEIEDIHLNAVQKSRPDYKNDTEETSGSLEDYYKFKGLPMPEPVPESEKTEYRPRNNRRN